VSACPEVLTLHIKLNRVVILIAAVNGLFFAAAPMAQAHHRDFVFLRDWYLPFAGENEVEFRMTHNNRMNEFLHEVEFEHGVTDHFAIEPGIEWHQQDQENLHLDGMDIELRFNFLEAKPNTILPALNVEWEHPFATDEADHGELKFVFSYYTPKGEDLSLNLNVGQRLNRGNHTKDAEIDLGYVRPLQKLEQEKHHGYKIGLRGGFEGRYDIQSTHFLQIGPTIAFEKDEHFNVIAHYFFGVNDRSNNSDGFRFIVEWEF
jgi:hypothetical protein